jgi:DMSO/TMAO reductase YedYZ molybdopterin-dependent catalytic subunit
MGSVHDGRLGRARAALTGVLAVAAGLAAGHLTAAAVGLGASPFVAVGNSAIDLTPAPVKDFAVRTFGVYDKLVLLAGMALTVLLLAMLAGALSRRSATPGTVLLGVLGVVAVVAVLTRPDLGQLAVVAPVVALVVAMVVFRRLRAVAADVVDVPEVRTHLSAPADTPSSPTGRRRFLAAFAGTALGAAAAGLAGELLGRRSDVQGSRAAVGEITPDVAAPPVPAGADFAADGTPTFITPNAEFYRVDTALVVPRLRAEDWQLRVHGMVDRELTLRYDELRTRPLVEHILTLTCVSNEVGGPYISTAKFVGVPLRDVLAEAGVQTGADQLVSRSADGWTCGTPTALVMEPDRGALLAIGMNDEPLPAEHGFPVRMVVPGLYGYVSATKWLVELELTTFDAFDAYWVRRGWAKRAPIKTMSRIDRPRAFGRVPAGTVTVAGVAWAQHRGIRAVEVRADQGPWRPATLSTEVNVDCWRMWRAELDLPPGGHILTVRATDNTGYTQTEQRADPAPDGATGWHSVSIIAT